MAAVTNDGRLAEMEEDEYLLTEASERMAANGDRPGIPLDKVMERHGITKEELDEIEDVLI